LSEKVASTTAADALHAPGSVFTETLPAAATFGFSLSVTVTVIAEVAVFGGDAASVAV
jgi:hypothetical protein